MNLCALHSYSVCPHSDYVRHHNLCDIEWHFVILTMSYMPSLMTSWSPDNDSLWPLQWCCEPFAMMFCAITVTSCVLIMIICDTMTLCDLHNDLCAPTMIMCDLHSNFCVLSQWICVLREFLSDIMSLCPLTMILCVLKMTVCDLTITMCALILTLWLSQLLWAFKSLVCPHSNFVCPHNDS